MDPLIVFEVGGKRLTREYPYVKIREVSALSAVMVTIGIEVVKAALLLGLFFTYLRNHQKIRSEFTLGLLLFAALFLVETLVAIYLYSTTVLCQVIQMSEVIRPVLSAIECAGMAVLAWITLK